MCVCVYFLPCQAQHIVLVSCCPRLVNNSNVLHLFFISFVTLCVHIVHLNEWYFLSLSLSLRSETMNGADFNQAITSAYAEVVHWRHNLFLTPSGNAGKRFVAELARLFRAYAEGTALEAIALKAAMVIPTLLLQKPHAASKARDHAICLHRRLQLWLEGDINNLIIEGRTIQHHLA